MKVHHKDILITDPCYIRRKDDEDSRSLILKEQLSNLRSPEGESCIHPLDYIVGGTYIGDWKCRVCEMNRDNQPDENKVLGQFSADSSMVAVMFLEQVRKYNPEIDKWIEEHPGYATVIKDFTGYVRFLDLDEVYSESGHTERHILGKGTTNFVSMCT